MYHYTIIQISIKILKMKNYKKGILATRVVASMPLIAATSTDIIKVTTFADEDGDGEIDIVRNPDGNMNVFEWPVNAETGEANKMMGTGTALSITEGTEFPETYVWTNGSGDCYQ